MTSLHMIAIPYPRRGHVNPMLNFCKSVALKRPDFLITVVVTEAWLGLLSSEPDFSRISSNIRFATIPDIVEDHIEKDRADLVEALTAFQKAVMEDMEEPVDRLLDRLQGPKPSVILYDSSAKWALRVARRRDIPAASFWILSATFFTLLYHWGFLIQNGQLPPAAAATLLENGEDRLTFIPGIPSIRFADLPKQMLDIKLPLKDALETHEIFTLSAKADYLLFNSIHELEPEALDSLRKEISAQTYTIGLAIPFLDEKEFTVKHGDHISWLDSQPKASVLYISQGSFLSSSDEQLDEYFAGIRDSGIRFFWVAKGKRDTFRDKIGSKGLVVEWCDQLKVLCHPSIGGFWSHCGWNSAKEAAFSGVPILASPILFDQITVRKQIVDDWKMGWRFNGYGDDDDGRLVKREEISRVLKRFMDSKCEEVKEMRIRAVELSKICKIAGSEGGASDQQIDAFIKKISN